MGCKDTGFRKLEFVAKTRLLWNIKMYCNFQVHTFITRPFYQLRFPQFKHRSWPTSNFRIKIWILVLYILGFSNAWRWSWKIGSFSWYYLGLSCCYPGSSNSCSISSILEVNYNVLDHISNKLVFLKFPSKKLNGFPCLICI